MENRPEIVDTESSIIHRQLLQWWAVIVASRIRLLVWIVVGLSIGLAIFFLSPSKYMAEATVITASSGGASSGLLAQAQMLTGMSFGQGDLAQVFPKVAESRQVLSRIIQGKYDDSSIQETLEDEFGVDLSEDAEGKEYQVIAKLRDAVVITFKSQESLVSVKVTLEDPNLAAEIANLIVGELRLFLNEIRVNKVAVQNTALETRLVEIADSLQVSEAALLDFRVHNRDLSRAPALKMEEGRLARKVDLFSQIFMELNQQFEILQIQKLNDSADFVVLDLAVAPREPSSPNLIRLMLYFLLLGLVFGLLDLQLIIWGEKSRFRPLAALVMGKRS